MHDSIKDTLRRSGHTGSVTLIYKIRHDKTGDTLIYKIRNDKTGEKSKQLYWESASKRAEGGFERDRNNIHANKTNRHTYVYKTE